MLLIEPVDTASTKKVMLVSIYLIRWIDKLWLCCMCCLCLLSARRGQYLAAVSRCAQSERGGVSIWQVRPWRVCVCTCACTLVCACVLV